MDNYLTVFGPRDALLFSTSFNEYKSIIAYFYNIFAGTPTKVVIKLRCDVEVQNEQPVFVKKDGSTYVFELKTSAVCGPIFVNCVLNDKFGNEYDLRPLSRHEYSNWMLRDVRSGHNTNIYHINVCRPLVKETAFNCPSEFSSAKSL